MFKVAFSLLLAGTLLSCKPRSFNDDSKTNANETGNGFKPTDLGMIFPLPKSEDDIKSRLTLSDIGVSQADFEALTAHVYMKAPLIDPTLDTESISFNVNKDGSFKNQPPSGCLVDPSRWRVIGVRMNPYGQMVPGSPAAYQAFAKQNGFVGQNLFEVRLTVKPNCEFNEFFKNFGSADVGFHLVYHPMDNATRASVLTSLVGFMSQQRAGQVDAAQAALKAYFQATNSESYKTFRKSQLNNWLELSKISNAAPAGTFDVLNKENEALKKKTINGMFNQADIAHPLLKDTNSAYRKKLNELVKGVANRANLTTIATFTTPSRGGVWTFSGFNVFSGISQNDLKFVSDDGKAEAQRVYKTLSPKRLETWFTEFTNNKIKLTKLLDLGYFTFSADMSSKSASITKEASANNFALLKKADFLHTVNGDTLKGQTLSDGLKLINDPSTTHASSASCFSCHSQQAVSDLKSGVDTEPQVNFHMMGSGGGEGMGMLFTSARMIAETENEASKLNAELGLKSSSTSVPSVAKVVCTVKDPDGSTIVRSTDGKVVAAIKNGTQLEKLSTPNAAGRFQVRKNGFISRNNTNCASTPADIDCRAPLVVKDQAPATLSLAKGTNFRQDATAASNLLGVMQNDATITFVESLSGNFIKVTLDGTVDASRCQ